MQPNRRFARMWKRAIQFGQACLLSPRRNTCPIVIYGQGGNGRSATTGRHLFELGGIPEREPDDSMQETIRLEKSSFALAFYTDKQTEEKKLGVDIACSTKELHTERWNSITISAPGYKDLIDMNTG